MAYKGCGTEVLPVIIGATGTISESFRTYLSIISGKQENKELYKTAIFDNANMPQKVLSKSEKHS
jgi:hypothetical protein